VSSPPPEGAPRASDPQRSAARPAALLAVRISPADVGARVSVRHRLHGDPAASLTDVVGVLLSWEAGTDGVAELRIERRDGSVVTVPAADLVAGKAVPPPRPRSSR
jgi:hypothetical protein